MSGETMSVLVIVLEGAWVDHMRGYDDEGETTPFLDELARQEVRFANASRTAASALPAVASLLTGLFPRAHGATEESGVLAAGPPTLAQLLRGAGYRTAAFSAAAAVSPTTGCDRAPTVLALVDVAGPDAPVQGRALLRDGAATPSPGLVFAEHYRLDSGDVRGKAVRSAREQVVWRSDEQRAYVSRAELGRCNQIDTHTAPADALRQALCAWLSDTERRMRDHSLDGTVGAAPTAARCAAVE